MKKLNQNDINLIRELGLDPEMVALRLTQMQKTPPRLSSVQLASIAAVDLNAAQREYYERTRLPRSDRMATTSFGDVLAERLDDETVALIEAAGWDAYEVQLLARDLSISGTQVALIESMFTNDNRALFPEFVNRIMARPPIIADNHVRIEDLIIGDITVTGGIGKAFDMSAIVAPKRKPVGERGTIPVASLSMSTKDLTVQKFPIGFDLSYEVQRRASVDLLRLFIELQADQFVKDKAIWALNLLYAGATDGGQTTISAKVPTMDVVRFVRAHRKAGYSPSLLVVPDTMDELLANNVELTDPRIGSFITTGDMPPIAKCPVKWVSDSTDLSTNKMVSVDRTRSAFLIREAGSEIMESEKKPSNQTEVYYWSESIGLNVVLETAVRKLQTKA